SSTRAPGGILVAALEPTATICSPSIITVMSGTVGEPVPSKSATCVIASAPLGFAVRRPIGAHARSKQQPANRTRFIGASTHLIARKSVEPLAFLYISE